MTITNYYDDYENYVDEDFENMKEFEERSARLCAHETFAPFIVKFYNLTFFRLIIN